MNKKNWIILVLVLLWLPVSAQAIEKCCSIRMTMRCNGVSIPGGTMTLYHVSDWDLTMEPEEMAVYAGKNGIKGTTLPVNNEGQVLFSDLQPGDYLLVQWEPAEGYLKMNPFRISLPMAVNGNLVYDIEAAPKLEQIPSEKLPQTGQMKWPVWIFLGLGLNLIGVGCWVNRRE